MTMSYNLRTTAINVLILEKCSQKNQEKHAEISKYNERLDPDKIWTEFADFYGYYFEFVIFFNFSEKRSSTGRTI